jgi:hypothetical protein
MSVNRLMVVVPLLAGLVVTGSAVARMLPAQSVRDSVYQTCAHNGVHFNKQGHANCGLHKGWSQGEPGSEPGSTTTSDQSTGDAGTSNSGAYATGGGHATHVHPTHPSKSHGAKTHGAKTHGAKTHSTTTHGAKAHGGGKRAHHPHG